MLPERPRELVPGCRLPRGSTGSGLGLARTGPGQGPQPQPEPQPVPDKPAGREQRVLVGLGNCKMAELLDCVSAAAGRPISSRRAARSCVSYSTPER